jgi:hypothetical protein
MGQAFRAPSRGMRAPRLQAAKVTARAKSISSAGFAAVTRYTPATMNFLRLTVAACVLVFLSACGQKEHAHGAAPAGGHAHTAPHGGTLIEIGAHAYNLEVLRDAATGKLTAWVLDGHAENFVRIKAATLELVATIGGEQRPLTLKAVANPATGETAGDTSQFEVQSDWLKSGGELGVVVPAIEIKGTKFEKIAAPVAKTAH